MPESGSVEGAGRDEDPYLTLTYSYPGPTVSLGTAVPLGDDQALLTGAAAAFGTTFTTHFEYGTTPALGSRTPDVSSEAVVTALIAGLAAETTYHYRLVAVDGRGAETRSQIRTFRTGEMPPPPPPLPSGEGPTPPSLPSGEAPESVPVPSLLKLKNASKRLDRRGRVSLRFSCTGGSLPCRAQVRLGWPGVRKPAKRVLRVAAGDSRKLRLRAPRRLRKRVGDHGVVRLRLRVAGRAGTTVKPSARRLRVRL